MVGDQPSPKQTHQHKLGITEVGRPSAFPVGGRSQTGHPNQLFFQTFVFKPPIFDLDFFKKRKPTVHTYRSMTPENTLPHKLAAFQRLLTIMDELREQCPWDRKQTMESLRPMTLEETHELADAILDGNMDEMKGELGDLFLHLVFYCKIGEEKELFDVGSVLNQVCDKLVRRHPHIYGDVQVRDAEEVKRNWEQIKLSEGRKSVLEGVPKSLPAVTKAMRVQEKAAQVGFDWPDKTQVWEKVQEETAEFQAAEAEGNALDMAEEFGDLLFALVNYARFSGIDPEAALERTNRKFMERFRYIEEHATKPLPEMTLAEMDVLWEAAKKRNRT